MQVLLLVSFAFYYSFLIWDFEGTTIDAAQRAGREWSTMDILNVENFSFSFGRLQKEK